MHPIASPARLLALLCAIALVLVACGTESPESPASVDQEQVPTDEETTPEVDESDEPDEADEPKQPSPEPAHAPPPDIAEPYEPVPGEIRPNAKRLAARVVEALTNYEVAAAPADVVAEVPGGPAVDDLLAHASEVLHEDAWSRGEIVYPQLGGLEEDETAVIVVVEQSVGLPDGSVHQQTRTMDVRLGLRDGHWALTELASAGGEPVPEPDDLTPEARAVLADERIDLPDSAVWDIHRGVVDDDLLQLMARMAERTPYGVIVFDTGHSWEVFGTERQSKHSMGQAVDIHRLAEGDPWVIDDRHEGSATHRLVQWIYEQPELSEVGSPWALDGFGGRSFSDQLHQDHLHVGVGQR